jgi:RNA polymerase sigma-70 factor, ECF subfamily
MEVEKDSPPVGADLVSRILAGDRNAETELVERYHRGVTAIIRREVGGAVGAAEDLYQETFRIALEKIRRGDLREPEKLSGFVCAVARNLVIDYFRRASRRESLTEIEDAAPTPDPAPSQIDQLLQRERAAIVRQVIDELPSDRDRQLLFRFYIAEEEKDRICDDLGLTPLHFNRVLFRARERYKELYLKAVNKR